MMGEVLYLEQQFKLPKKLRARSYVQYKRGAKGISTWVCFSSRQFNTGHRVGATRSTAALYVRVHCNFKVSKVFAYHGSTSNNSSSLAGRNKV
jgi:hypothetical protein